MQQREAKVKFPNSLAYRSWVMSRIREKGGEPFRDLQLPEAVLKFRQGVGRLIRSREDRGQIAVLDGRILTKSYGKVFLQMLPECEIRVLDFEGCGEGLRD